MGRWNYSRYCAGAAALILGVAVLLSACGDVERAPLSPGSEGDVGAPSALAKPGKPETGKELGPPDRDLITAVQVAENLYVSETSAWFQPDIGGALSATFPEYGDKTTVRVKRVTFKAKKVSIDQPLYVTMKVTSGVAPGDIRIEFDPSGTEFSPPTKLEISISADTIDESLSVYHVSADGKVADVQGTIDHKGKTFWIIKIDVFGFSYYDLADDEYADEADVGDGS